MAANSISASRILQYFEEVTAKKDWSKKGWAEWCSMEKGIHPKSMQILSEVRSLFLHFSLLVGSLVILLFLFCVVSD